MGAQGERRPPSTVLLAEIVFLALVVLLPVAQLLLDWPAEVWWVTVP